MREWPVRVEGGKIVVRWDPPPQTCPCPCCGTHDTKTVKTVEGYRHHKCRRCLQRFCSLSLSEP